MLFSSRDHIACIFKMDGMNEANILVKYNTRMSNCFLINMNQCNRKISHSCLVLHMGVCFIHPTHFDNAANVI